MTEYSSPRTRWATVVVFAIAMAWVEAASVFYIRALVDRIEPYQANPLPMNGALGTVELCREAATLVMIAALGLLAGRSWRRRAGYAAVAFGVWDIFYYVFLRLISGWPRTLLDWDILFLLPLPWWGPVLAPISIALVMIVWGTLATRPGDVGAVADGIQLAAVLDRRAADGVTGVAPACRLGIGPRASCAIVTLTLDMVGSRSVGLRNFHAERSAQGFDAVRLQQQSELSVVHARNGVRVTGGQENLQLRMTSPDFAGELQAVETAGHHHVGQHDVDVAPVAERAQRGLGAGDSDHRETKRVQQLARERRHLLVVFDEEDLPAALTVTGGIACARRVNRRGER